MKSKTFLIGKDKKLYTLKPQQIIFIEANGRYTKINSEIGAFWVSKSLKKWKFLIDNSTFIQINRNIIIPLSSIAEIYISDNLLGCKDGSTYTLGRAFKKEVLKKFIIM